jgi:hypothetical protein
MVWSFTLISAALLVATLEGANVNGLNLHDGPRSPFLPERLVEVELDHSGRRLQVDDVSLNRTQSCGLCRGLEGAIVLLADTLATVYADGTVSWSGIVWAASRHCVLSLVLSVSPTTPSDVISTLIVRPTSPL